MILTHSIIQLAPLLIFSMICSLGLSGAYWDLILACIWGLLIFQSLLGYGRLTLLLMPNDPVIKSISPVFGLAFWLIIGAYLNLSGLFIRPIIVILIVFGVMFFFWFYIRNDRDNEEIQNNQNFFNRSKSDQIIFCIFLVVCFWVYLAATSQTEFNIHDDAHGYLYFPHKLLELGTLGVDPFSERRVISGFGAGALWNGLGFSYIQPDFIHVMDLGIGFFVLSYVIIQFPTGNQFYKTKFLFLIAFGLIKFPAVNITPNFISIPIILSIWIMLLSISNHLIKEKLIPKVYWLSFGSIIFTLVVLKNTYIPYATLSVFASLVYLYFARRLSLKKCIDGILWLTLVVFILAVPWAIDLKESSGTYFYPFLGVGTHAIQYGYFPPATANFMLWSTWINDLKILFWPFTKSIYIISLVFVLCYVTYSIYRRVSICIFSLPCLPILISLINVLIVGYAIGGYGAYRFVYAPAVGSLLAALILTFYFISSSQISLKFRYFLYALLCILFIRVVQDTYNRSLVQFDQIHQSLLSGGQFQKVYSDPYRRLSSAIPKEGGILVRIDKPFLLSPLSNNVYIADYPGSASLAPGMPFGEGPENLRHYLLSKGINYIVWGYGNQANFSRQIYGYRLSDKENSWIRSEAKLAFDFQDNVEQLRKKYKNIYDADGIVIIDLR